MNFLLDTCIISELVRKKPEKKVIRWLESCDEETLFLSVLTVGEIQKGIAKLPDDQKQKKLEKWLDQDLKQRFEGRILSVDCHVANIWGQLMGQAEKKGNIMPVIDSLIAATALAHNLTVVTRNTADILKSGAPILNPWEKTGKP